MVSFLGPGDLALVALIVSVAACAQMVSGFGFGTGGHNMALVREV